MLSGHTGSLTEGSTIFLNVLVGPTWKPLPRVDVKSKMLGMIRLHPMPKLIRATLWFLPGLITIELS